MLTWLGLPVHCCHPTFSRAVPAVMEQAPLLGLLSSHMSMHSQGQAEKESRAATRR